MEHGARYRKELVNQLQSVRLIVINLRRNGLFRGRLIKGDPRPLSNPNNSCDTPTELSRRLPPGLPIPQRCLDRGAFIVSDAVHVGTAPTAQRIAITAMTPMPIAITVVAFIRTPQKTTKAPIPGAGDTFTC
jgi:hypothetical protein